MKVPVDDEGDVKSDYGWPLILKKLYVLDGTLTPPVRTPVGFVAWMQAQLKDETR